jgi:hypothetical protein
LIKNECLKKKRKKKSFIPKSPKLIYIVSRKHSTRSNDPTSRMKTQLDYKNIKIRVIWIFLRSKGSREGREGVRTMWNAHGNVCVCFVRGNENDQNQEAWPKLKHCLNQSLGNAVNGREQGPSNVGKFCKSWRMSNKLHAQSFFYKC